MSDEIDDRITGYDPGTEPPTRDAEKGAMIGGVGGLVAGAIAGAAVGPGGVILGAVIGGVVGAAASGAAVAVVDKYDDDNQFSGLPDDMSLVDPSDREPLVLNRDEVARSQIPSNTPLGVGLPEAIAMAGPSNMAETEASEWTGEAESVDLPMTSTGPTDSGWSRDADANTLCVNPAGIAPPGACDPSKAAESLPNIGSGSLAYADNPEGDIDPKG